MSIHATTTCGGPTPAPHVLVPRPGAARRAIATPAALAGLLERAAARLGDRLHQDVDVAASAEGWQVTRTRWGGHPIEAAAELLIRACRGRLLSGPWIGHTNEGRVWFDADIAAEPAPLLSGGEERVLHIAASLAGGWKVDLNELVAGLDRDALAVVLAALAHAGGSHQHSGLVPDPDGPWTIRDGGQEGGPESGQAGTRMAFRRLGSLYPWPACTKDSRQDTTEDGQDSAPDNACQEGDAR